MPSYFLRPGAGARLHQFAVGAIPIIAFLTGRQEPVWAALGLSLAALVSVRLVLVGRAWNLLHRGSGEPTLLCFYHGVHRWDEAVRAALLAAGLALLVAGDPTGWLAILTASAIAILAGATGFSFVTVFYALAKAAWVRLVCGRAAWLASARHITGNPKCLVCRTLGAAPYHRCTWCSLPSVRSCCGMQTSMLLALMLVIAFLLTASLNPLVMKMLVTMSIVAVVALALAITRQTDDLVTTLEGLAEEQRRAERRCAFLRRLAMAGDLKTAAEETVAYAEAVLSARRISVMVAEDDVLHIVASRGIPEDTAREIAVPIGERICGRVFASGRPVVMRNVLSERPHEALGLQTGGAVASYPLATAQMSAAGRKIGVINATDKPGGEFSQAELAELEFISEAAAITLASQMAGEELQKANFGTIVTLAMTLEAKDPYTNGHSARVQARATAVGRELGLAGRRLEALSCAGQLHDIGKLAVPDSILTANRRLTDYEWAIIREHPRRGVEMLKHLTFLKDVQPAILYHHERLDGSGYPEGLPPARIPLEARILAVIDAYDAMTSARAYRPAMSHEAAAAELRRCCGTQFDPRIVEVFLRLLGDEVAATVGSETAATAEN
ncbi:MAG: HD domain-containing protein [Planctomycetes bacterium]|nr:HD domain-containing protein [Planctomycetota bacterium]